MVTRTVEMLTDEELDTMPREDLKKLAKIRLIFAVVTSKGKGKDKEINPGEVFECLPGESLTVKLLDPRCDGEKVDKKGIFTLYVEKDIDEEDVKVNQNSTETENIIKEVKIPGSDFLGTSKKISVNVKDKKCLIQ